MSFKELYGQTEVKKLLVRSLQKKRIASAYLFFGPEGVGKAMTSIIYSKAMNCRLHEADACPAAAESEQCPSCKKIEKFSHPDIAVILPAPKKIREEKGQMDVLRKGDLHAYRGTEIIAIGDIRAIESALLLKPFEARRRVVIVLDAESMNQEAQNAFLKLLEEPPADTTIILTSSKPERLFPTIRSRCQKIPFRRLEKKTMERYIKERFEINQREMELVCLLSNGSIGKAQSLLDDERKEERELLKALVIERDFEKLQGIERRDTLQRFIDFLIPLMRDIEVAPFTSKILNVDMSDYVQAAGKRYTLDEIRERIDFLTYVLSGLARNVSPRIMAHVVYNSVKDV